MIVQRKRRTKRSVETPQSRIVVVRHREHHAAVRLPTQSGRLEPGLDGERGQQRALPRIPEVCNSSRMNGEDSRSVGTPDRIVHHCVPRRLELRHEMTIQIPHANHTICGEDDSIGLDGVQRQDVCAVRTPSRVGDTDVLDDNAFANA